jgi:hypothetical protein
VYINKVHLVNSRCLYEATHGDEPIDRAYLRSRYSQLTLLHETTHTVDAIIGVYLTNPDSQLALFVRENYVKTYLVNLVN